MKALWFMPFTFAAGAEGFALFVPYLILVLTAVYVVRSMRKARRAMPALILARPAVIEIPADAHPAI